MLCLRLTMVWCLLAGGAFAAETMSAPATDLRESLASTTRERDELQTQVDRLEQQRGFLIAVAGLLTIAVGLLVRAHLLGKRRKLDKSEEAVEAVEIGEQDPFPEAPEELITATTVTMRKRKNATITIRNGSTQQEEVTEQVQTRRFFSPGEPRRPARRESSADIVPAKPDSEPVPSAPPATARSTRKLTTATPTPRNTPLVELSETDSSETELKPGTDRTTRSDTDSGANQGDSPRRPKTVRVDHQSDRMEVVEVTVKPGTTGIFRRQGFTVLEVMISVALLATVLSSVMASTYTLHRTRQLAKEDNESQMLGRLFIERIMAESWGSLHSGVPGALWKANHADDSLAVPLTAQVLKDKNIVEELPSLNDLKVYIEYYPQSAMEDAIINRQPVVLTNRLGWRDRTMVFRIVIDWRSIDGNPRRHVQWFARSE